LTKVASGGHHLGVFDAPILFIVLATAWSGLVIELVIESARTGARELAAFGYVLAAPDGSVGIWILCGVSATAALAMVTAVAYARGRRLERRMAAELDGRWEEISERNASDATRIRLLSWRVAELHTLVNRLGDDRAATRSGPPRLVVVPDSPEDVASGR
jgi:hypothetical protein